MHKYSHTKCSIKRWIERETVKTIFQMGNMRRRLNSGPSPQNQHQGFRGAVAEGAEEGVEGGIIAISLSSISRRVATPAHEYWRS